MSNLESLGFYFALHHAAVRDGRFRVRVSGVTHPITKC